MKKHLTKPQYYTIINLESLREDRFFGVVVSKQLADREVNLIHLADLREK